MADEDDPEALVEWAAGVVRSRYLGRVSDQLLEELIACGLLGLAQALIRWTPKRGAFRPYAHRRVLGEAIDYARRHYGRNSAQGRKPLVLCDDPYDGRTAGVDAHDERRVAQIRLALTEHARIHGDRTAAMLTSYVVDRRTMDDIGQDHGITETTVLYHIQGLADWAARHVERLIEDVA